MPSNRPPSAYDQASPPVADLAIVGGGAAGLAAAIFTAQALASRNLHARIVILDSAPRLGTKILVSGGARCNVTHTAIAPSDYNAPQPVVRNILRQFTQQQTVDWFASLGVTLKTEPTGKLFPTSDDAQTVLQALLNEASALGIQILAKHKVTAVELVPSPSPNPQSAIPNPQFLLTHSQGSLLAHHLILATGGRSLPKSGSDGTGYTLAASLNHSVTPTYPALVPLLLDPNFFHPQLSGISHEATLTTLAYTTTSIPHNTPPSPGMRSSESPGYPHPALQTPPSAPPSSPITLDRRTGSILWTHFGISGPLAMDASRHWILANANSFPDKPGDEAPESPRVASQGSGVRVQDAATLPPPPLLTGEGRGEGSPPLPQSAIRNPHSAIPPLLLLNFIPTETYESAERWLLGAAAASPKRSVVAVLADRLPRRVAEVLATELNLAAPAGTPRPGKPLEIAQLPRELRRALLHTLTALPLPVQGDRGWNYAEVTAGGIPLSEINFRTMESRKTPRLHLIGEILDCDGRIGGFNFQWAWSTAHTAAQAIAKSIANNNS